MAVHTTLKEVIEISIVIILKYSNYNKNKIACAKCAKTTI